MKTIQVHLIIWTTLDVNNLYGWVMSQLLPTGGFNWVDPSELTPDKIESCSNWDSEGYYY